MPEQDKQLKDRDLVSKLLDLSTELLIKGDADHAFTCTQAAARILAIPLVSGNIHHPSGKVPTEWMTDFERDFDEVLQRLFGLNRGGDQ